MNIWKLFLNAEISTIFCLLTFSKYSFSSSILNKKPYGTAANSLTASLGLKAQLCFSQNARDKLDIHI